MYCTKRRGYSRAQLQGNIYTHPKRVLHAFQISPALVVNVSSSGKKGRGTHVHLAAALSRGFALARMRLVHVLHPRPAFQTHSNVILELSCTVLDLMTIKSINCATPSRTRVFTTITIILYAPSSCSIKAAQKYVWKLSHPE